MTRAGDKIIEGLTEALQHARDSRSAPAGEDPVEGLRAKPASDGGEANRPNSVLPPSLQDERVERLASGIVATLWPNLEDAPRVADEIAAKIAPLVLAALSPAQADAVPADDEDATDFQCPNCKRYQYKAHGFECEECGTDCTPPAQADAASLPLVDERRQVERAAKAIHQRRMLGPWTDADLARAAMPYLAALSPQSQPAAQSESHTA